MIFDDFSRGLNCALGKLSDLRLSVGLVHVLIDFGLEIKNLLLGDLCGSGLGDLLDDHNDLILDGSSVTTLGDVYLEGIDVFGNLIFCYFLRCSNFIDNLLKFLSELNKLMSLLDNSYLDGLRLKLANNLLHFSFDLLAFLNSFNFLLGLFHLDTLLLLDDLEVSDGFLCELLDYLDRCINGFDLWGELSGLLDDDVEEADLTDQGPDLGGFLSGHVLVEV